VQADAADALRDRLEPAVTAAGYDLDDLVVTSAGRRRLVRLVVDKDGGVTLDECAEVSRAVSALLDANDALLGAGPYTLEVSSRGVSRPLTMPRHWQRNVGRLVKSVRADGSTVLGRIVRADEQGATLRPEVGADVDVEYPDVTRALVQVEMRRDPPEQ
jgi:ribosome maturation factor RimP